MSEMPLSMPSDMEESGEPVEAPQEEVMEAQEAPMDPAQAPEGMEPMPEQPVTDPVVDDMDEFEARDRLELELMLTAEKMCEAVRVASKGAAAKDAEQYAAAAQHLVQAAVLLAPQEAVDDAIASGGDPVGTAQLMNTTTKGLRRKAGS